MKVEMMNKGLGYDSCYVGDDSVVLSGGLIEAVMDNDQVTSCFIFPVSYFLYLYLYLYLNLYLYLF